MSNIFSVAKQNPIDLLKLPSIDKASKSALSKMGKNQLKSLSKISGKVIKNDLELDDAKKLVQTKFKEELFSSKAIENLRKDSTPLKGLKANVAALSSSLDLEENPLKIALDKQESVFELGNAAKDACGKFELPGLECPICPDWPDFELDFEWAKYQFEFDGILDSIMDLSFPDFDLPDFDLPGFGDFSFGEGLFGMFGKCPQYLLSAGASKIGSISDKMANAGSIDMLNTLTGSIGADKIPGLEEKVIKAASRMKPTSANFEKLDSLTSKIPGLDKKKLVSSKVQGLTNDILDVRKIEKLTGGLSSKISNKLNAPVSAQSNSKESVKDLKIKESVRKGVSERGESNMFKRFDSLFSEPPDTIKRAVVSEPPRRKIKTDIVVEDSGAEKHTVHYSDGTTFVSWRNDPRAKDPRARFSLNGKFLGYSA